MENDIDDVVQSCATLPYWNVLDEVRQCVVADMVFNLGLEGFRGFRKLHSALAVQDFTRAAYEMRNSRWFAQVGARGARLETAMREGTF